jgi:membrane protein insertase Oxa1/YidC/SpoIIIJ
MIIDNTVIVEWKPNTGIAATWPYGVAMYWPLNTTMIDFQNVSSSRTIAISRRAREDSRTYPKCS